MQLLYMWIKDYSCLKEVGLNFNSKYKFDFNLNKYELLFSKNNEAIDGFFNVISKKEILAERTAATIINKEYDIFECIKNGTVNNLTAIVGNNGAGKSTVLNLICDIFVNGLDNWKNVLYCFIENEKIYIHSTLKRDIYLNNKNKADVEFYKCELTEDYAENYENFNLYTHVNGKKTKIKGDKTIVTSYNNSLKDNTPVIYFSNEFNAMYSDKPYKPITDISTSGLLKSDFHNDLENHKVELNANLIKCFNDNEMIRQIEYIYDSNENKHKYLEFELPKQAFVTFRDNDSILMRIYQSLNSEYKNKESIIDINKDLNLQIGNINSGILNVSNITEENKLLLNIYQLIEKFEMRNINSKLPKAGTKESLYIQFSIKMLIGMFISFLYEYLIIYSTNMEITNTMNNSLETNFFNNNQDLLEHEMLYDSFITFFKDILNIIHKDNEKSKWDDEVKKKDKEYIDCIKKFKDEINAVIVTDKDKMDYSSMSQKFILYTRKENIMSSLKHFYNCYKKTSKYLHYLDFSWGISAGEYNMISLFARLYSIINKETGELEYFDNQTSCIEMQKNDIVLLIDEADLSYHAEWQQKYIKNLLNFLKENYNSCNIQLILTTHSPILLSDIPNNNIIFLKKIDEITKVIDNKTETFGANIYNLYREGFFLQGSNFGILGEFATSKIEEVEKIISKWDNKIKKIEYAAKNKTENTLNYQQDKQKNIDIVETLSDIRTKAIKELDYCRKIINIIGEKFIKDIMLDLYNDIYKRLDFKKERDSNSEVEKMKNMFEQLSEENQNLLIQQIIEIRKK
ncbi:AAA family ATPase [Clostridium saccharoperbutylacetonicum]|uniref:AAA family ATPase n=1 Tax=Clostridium saccharoperbutylacetonicum TaxID=36745 RepID=UPI000983EEE3|nr:AAA family ATPase [Clostridium saccharoperbutylacetonicum]AQR96143.1 hypothetical protein CLSAP_34620 [Clostridium saccharoperbutylacetonicum]NSB32013.1 putative ATPase [Clostridium saccharoperbutylacetonicum]